MLKINRSTSCQFVARLYPGKGEFPSLLPSDFSVHKHHLHVDDLKFQKSSALALRLPKKLIMAGASFDCFDLVPEVSHLHIVLCIEIHELYMQMTCGSKNELNRSLLVLICSRFVAGRLFR